MHVMILGRCSTSLLPIRYVLEISKQFTSVYSKNFSSVDNNILTLRIQSSKRQNSLVTLSTPFSRMASTSSDSKGGTPTTKHPTNKLILEKSPYLLQHATNPVEWYPWGEEAFEKAKREDKLIFLSVGYSTCHWCHVMERESFEDSEIAKVMNKYFVNIKVDREERPDIDRIYMTFVQMISGHGGWPMSVFLTPDLVPVTGGTYFPPTDKYGQPGFKSVLLGIAGKWLTSKEDILKSGKTILEVLKRSSQEHRENTEIEVPPSTFGRICAKKLADRYDEEFGGFSDAPKFPQPVNLNLLFHVYAADPSSELGKLCLNMCTHTLTKMANGGIHDHVGQGFSRYSVDGKWHVPHFEKMLYDQGQLLKSYADAFAITKDPFYADIADDIVTYVTRDLRHSEGGFYSAEDADSLPTHDSTSKREGAFYVWTHDEIQMLLHDEIGNDLRLSDVFSHHFSVKPKGNVERYQDPHGELSGKNVLIVYGSLRETAEKFHLSVEETKEHLQKSLRILLEARSERPRPHLDDKIVTAWNGLMISGLSRAGAVLGKQRYIDYAVDAAKFIECHLYNESKGVLLRSCYRGDENKIMQTSVPIEGFHADYAFVIRGFLDLYEASFESHWLEFAEKLQDVQDKLFWDNKNAGYFSTTDDNPTVIVRLKDDQDGAEPSGNSVACGNLLKLSSYLEREDLKDKAARLLSSFREPIMRVPLAFPELITALLHYHDTTTRIYVVGKKDSDDTKKLLRVAQERLIPGKILLLADDERRDGILFRKSQVMGKMKPLQGFAAAYVCRHHTCSLPVTNPEELEKLLDEKQLDTSL